MTEPFSWARAWTVFRPGADAPPLTDAAAVDRLYRRNRWKVMVGITVGYSLYYTCRLGFTVMKKPLIDGGIFNAEELGQLGSALFYAYALGKLANGFLADHTNAKWFFPVGLFLSAVANLVLGANTAFWTWATILAFNGWFQGFGAAGSVVVLSAWFSNRERGRYYGIWSTSHALGEGATFLLTSALVSALGWRAGFWGPGGLCVVGAVALYFFLEDRPATLGLPPVAQWRGEVSPAATVPSGAAVSARALQLQVLKTPAIWVLGFSSAAMYVTRYGVNSWGTLYLQEAKGYTLLQAGSLLTLNTVAGVAGSVAFGFFSDKVFASRRPPANLVFGLLEVGSLLVFFFAPPGQTLLLAISMAVYGFSMSGILASLGGLFAVDIASKRASGAAMGMIGGFSNLAAALQERVSGLLIQRGSTTAGAVHHYDFGPVIAFWVAGSVISLLLATSLWRVRVVD